MSSKCDPRKDKDNKDSHAQSLKKKATSGKGRHNQARGSAKHNTSPQYAKPSKKGVTDFTDDTPF